MTSLRPLLHPKIPLPIPLFWLECLPSLLSLSLNPQVLLLFLTIPRGMTCHSGKQESKFLWWPKVHRSKHTKTRSSHTGNSCATSSFPKRYETYNLTKPSYAPLKECQL